MISVSNKIKIYGFVFKIFSIKLIYLMIRKVLIMNCLIRLKYYLKILLYLLKCLDKIVWY